MANRMQDTRHDKSAYVRPSQTWHCGLAEHCQAGPTLDGCCSQNGLPCTPYRSVKASRKRVYVLVLCAAFALFVLLLGVQSLLPILSPGPLSAAHSEAASCQDCHAATEESMSDWVHKAITLNSNNDDQKCLSCHKLGANAFSPHSVSASNLNSFIRSLATSNSKDKLNSLDVNDLTLTLARKVNSWQTTPDKEVSCSSCHREHKGKFAPLDGFDSQQCHSCHQVTFNKIEEGHPEYSQFPHNRATRINFDHVAHLQNYFLEDDAFEVAPEGCLQCHETDASGEWMLSNSFEQACSSCHLNEIFGDNRASAKGVAVLSVPELDVVTLRKGGYNVGDWPDWADGEITPIMRALLQTSEEAKVSKARNLYDLSSSSRQELRETAALAWRIKELFYDIQIGGTKALGDRLRGSFGHDLDQSTINRLVASLPKDTLVNNQLEWFPDLLREVKEYRQGKIQLFDLSNNKLIEKSVDDDILAEDGDDILAEDGDDILAEDGDDILAEDGDDILAEDGDAILAEDGDDILAEDGDDILAEDDGDILAEDGDDILAEDDDDILAEDDGDEIAIDDAVTIVDAPYSVIEADNESWALSGGWYRDGSSIFYRPVDHADQFFQTWLDLSSADNASHNSKIFESLTEEDSVGACVKCHTSEVSSSDRNQRYKVNWNSFKPQDIDIDFNRFSHVSHFSLMNDDGCSSCHSLNEGELEIESLSGESFTSSFMNMDRQTCTQCHQQGRAPDNCLTCHNYHADTLMQPPSHISDTLRGKFNE